MKTSNSSSRSEQIFVVKQIFFALEIIIICVAIPLLSYLQLTYKSNTPENDSRSAMGVTTQKHNGTAFTANNTAVIHEVASLK